MLEGKCCNFVLDAGCNWEPVELLQKGSYVIRFLFVEDESSSVVLDFLQKLQSRRRKARQNSIAIVKS